MTYVIYAHGLEGQAVGGTGTGKGYVKAYSPNAFDGRGLVDFTNEVVDALRFDTLDQATTFFRQVPAKRPVRPDGKPNRPLTAYTVEFVRVA